MKRLLRTLTLLTALLAALTFTAAPAFADRTVGWQRNDCFKDNGTVDLEMQGKIVWFSGSNLRDVEWEGVEFDAFGDQVHATEVQVFAMAVGGTWTMIYQFSEDFLPPPNAYYIQYTPSENPGQGHYFTSRYYFPDGQCQTPVQLD